MNITLSKPSKMPCHGYSLPASACHTGAKLATVEGTICNDCYACKGRYNFPNVKNALARRLDAIEDPLWTQAMIALIRKNEKSGHFRWHDSGDIQSIDHLKKIIEIAAALPVISFWLPTREVHMILSFIRSGGQFPDNLNVRLSAVFPDEPANSFAGLTTSTVHDKLEPYGHVCPAPMQGNQCKSCRACWSKSVQNVSYAAH